MPDAYKVNSMFARIASRYDLANRLLSFGIDQIWRNRLVEEVDYRKPTTVVDLATGSGDVAFALREGLAKSTVIKGLDFCAPMIDEAKKKQVEFQEPEIEFGIGDILDLPLDTGLAQAATISFGYRNLEDRHTGLLEIRRILDPENGYIFILEFSQPHPVYRPFYYFYLKRVLPIVASLITGDLPAYQYLCNSIETFPDREGISSELEQAGFREIIAIPLALGSVALHIAKA
jgi:demethylmenaquinone methyltransferase/2-methoxy-6-polyprenyl-1,4-benzoquinol methylase